MMQAVANQLYLRAPEKVDYLGPIVCIALTKTGTAECLPGYEEDSRIQQHESGKITYM